jgi:hypothetical protein
MRSLSQTLTTLSALLGPVATILGLVQSSGWLVGVGVVLVCVAIGAVVYANTHKRRVLAASVEIEGISIDLLNAANLRRRTNRSLTIQSAELFESREKTRT